MTNDEFIYIARGIVRDYAIKHMDRTDDNEKFETYVVWNCFILGHQKALISTTLHDGMYYEVTYNSTKDEIYFDAYKKFENRCFREPEAFKGDIIYYE